MVEKLQSEETDLQRYIELLKKPGDTNSYLEQTLPENPDFNRRHDIADESLSCRLGEIPEEEELIYPQEGFLDQPPYYITSTQPAPGTPERGWRDGRKGHQIRNMAVWNGHGELPALPETYHNGLNFAEKLRDITSKQIENGYEVVGGSMNTFEEHLHFVASDLEFEQGAESDFPELNNWFLYRVENGEASELIDYRSQEKIGGYLEELLL
jgi:hypothetical protein